MSQQLLRRAWDALDSFKQAYPENWHEDDQQVMDDLLKADLDLSGVKRKWVDLTDGEIEKIRNTPMSVEGGVGFNIYSYARAIEKALKEKNT